MTPDAVEPPRRLFLLDGHSLSYRAYFAPLARDDDRRCERRLRLHLDADQAARRRAAGPRSRWRSTWASRPLRLEKYAEYKAGGPRRRTSSASSSADRRGARDAADPGDRHRGPRGGRRDRHARAPGPRPADRRGSRHGRPRLLPARPARAHGDVQRQGHLGHPPLRCPGGHGTPASHPRSTSTTSRSRATRRTTSRGAGRGGEDGDEARPGLRVGRGALGGPTS